MTTSKPHYCNDTAFSLFARHANDLEAEGALLRAAVAIAMHEMPEVSVESVESQLDALARRILSRVRSDDPKALLSHAHMVLFDEEGFTGNAENYYDPKNSFIPAVLETRRGIPISLALVYKEVLERLGLNVSGTNMPGHFLVSVWMDRRPMLVDPFMRGRVISREEALARVTDLVGEAARERRLLRPATNRGWIARMLHNLTVVYAQSQQQSSLAAMLELQAVLAFRGDRA